MSDEAPVSSCQSLRCECNMCMSWVMANLNSCINTLLLNNYSKLYCMYNPSDSAYRIGKANTASHYHACNMIISIANLCVVVRIVGLICSQT